jgi:hypothetical protein
MLAGTEFASGFTLITPESVFSSNLTGKSMVAVSFESKQGARRAGAGGRGRIVCGAKRLRHSLASRIQRGPACQP